MCRNLTAAQTLGEITNPTLTSENINNLKYRKGLPLYFSPGWLGLEGPNNPSC